MGKKLVVFSLVLLAVIYAQAKPAIWKILADPSNTLKKLNGQNEDSTGAVAHVNLSEEVLLGDKGTSGMVSDNTIDTVDSEDTDDKQQGDDEAVVNMIKEYITQYKKGVKSLESGIQDVASKLQSASKVISEEWKKGVERYMKSREEL